MQIRERLHVRKSTILLCILGFTSLIVGSILAIRPIRAIITNSVFIRSYGRIAYPDNVEPQDASSATTLDRIGYVTVLASIAFFAIAFLRNRKST